MAQVTITSPVPGYNGRSAGVQFADGKAVIEDNRHAALEYFSRHGYGIDKPIELPGEDGKRPASKAREVAGSKPADQTGKGSRSKATKADKAAAPKLVTATEKQAGIESNGPENVAGDGPAGALHNKGRDGADPSNTGTPTTPVDATI